MQSDNSSKRISNVSYQNRNLATHVCLKSMSGSFCYVLIKIEKSNAGAETLSTTRLSERASKCSVPNGLLLKFFIRYILLRPSPGPIFSFTDASDGDGRMMQIISSLLFSLQMRPVHRCCDGPCSQNCGWEHHSPGILCLHEHRRRSRDKISTVDGFLALQHYTP